jgi:tryptophan synthase alpha chain
MAIAYFCSPNVKLNFTNYKIFMMNTLIIKNRLNAVFAEKKDILNIYFTAGFPQIGDTVRIIKTLQKAGVDMIEIGVPFSDPLADGEIIQKSSQCAIENGMTLKLLFEQLQYVRNEVDIPLLLMGYLNPVLQFGMENFCQKCEEIGIDGIILPDLPAREFVEDYQSLFEKHQLANVFLITPQTTEQRIRQIDEISQGFIYMVSSASTTGTKNGTADSQIAYFERIKAMNLQMPKLIGFGISDNQSFATANQYANGAIIGSAFIKMLSQSTDLERDIEVFIRYIKE